MKTRSLKKVLSVVLATSMVMAMGVFTFATPTQTNTDPAPAATVEPTPAVVEETPAPVVTETTVAGVKSTVEGSVVAKSIEAFAIAAPKAELAANYGLAQGETAVVAVSDFDSKGSKAAQNVISFVASSQNAVVGPSININLAKKSGGKLVALAQDGAQVPTFISLPKKFYTPGATYAVICVRPGGGFSILPAAVDANGNLAFFITGGQGTYSVIKY